MLALIGKCLLDRTLAVPFSQSTTSPLYLKVNNAHFHTFCFQSLPKSSKCTLLGRETSDHITQKGKPLRLGELAGRATDFKFQRQELNDRAGSCW